jgi:hypothetical protein
MNDWISSQKKLRDVLGPEPFRPMHRLIEAYSQLRFAGLDNRVWSEIVSSLSYVERLCSHRDQVTLDAWGEVRGHLFDAIRASGDGFAIEAVEPAEELGKPLVTRA